MNKTKAKIEVINILIEYKFFEKKINNKIMKNRFIFFFDISENQSLIFSKFINNEFKKMIITMEIL